MSDTNVAKVFASRPFRTMIVQMLTESVNVKFAENKVSRYERLTHDIDEKVADGKHPTQSYTARAEIGREMTDYGISKDMLLLFAKECRMLSDID